MRWSAGSTRSSPPWSRARPPPRRTPGFAGDPRAAQGYVHAGANGAGHFTKMVHNGIEYGMMQAFAEGLDILKHADSEALPEEHRLSLNLGDVTEAWRRGSVVASWLLDLTAQALAQDPELESFSGHVSDSGEGRWTVQAAVETAVSAPVLSAALYARFASRDEDRVLRQGALGPAQGLRRASGAGEGGRLMPKPLVLVMGVSGAGKSTVGALLAARLDAPFADADAFHPPANIAKMSRGEPLTDDDRWPWLDAIGAWLDAQAPRGERRRGDLLGAQRIYRDRLLAGRPGVRLLHLSGDAALIGARQAARPDHFMPASLMASQFATLEAPGEDGGHDRAVGRAAAGGDRGDGVPGTAALR